MPDHPTPEPEVARGLGAPDSTRLVDDPYTGVRADHHRPARRPLPPEQEASPSAERGEIDVASEVQDAQVVPDAPSVWEALGEDDVER